ncbi:MAG TPA: hypothetical protein VGR26_11720 [Acidimicrobiales bacterium]|nr:hypothetical protein [Acidimicrobiales bacterium]
MTGTIHPLGDEYLRRLERATRVLPRGQREELLAEIRSHIEAGLAPDATDAEARNLLDDLGSPADIVAAARPDEVPARRGAREVFALVVLVVGIPPFLGWLVGVALLVSSPLWSTRQKLLGILVWPGGLMTVAAVAAGLVMAVPSPVSNVLMAVLALAPLVVAVYLYQEAGRQADAV